VVDRPAGSVLSKRRALALAALGLSLVGAGEPIELETQAGRPVALALEAGERALLVHFWATWCAECVEELPILAAAIARCGEAGVRIVTANVGEEPEHVADFLERHRLDLPVLRDPKARAWRTLGGVGLPTNAVLTGEGRRVEVGARDARTWSEALAQLGCPPEATP
jgi:peroxiredoxin